MCVRSLPPQHHGMQALVRDILRDDDACREMLCTWRRKHAAHTDSIRALYTKLVRVLFRTAVSVAVVAGSEGRSITLHTEAFMRIDIDRLSPAMRRRLADVIDADGGRIVAFGGGGGGGGVTITNFDAGGVEEGASSRQFHGMRTARSARAFYDPFDLLALAVEIEVVAARGCSLPVKRHIVENLILVMLEGIRLAEDDDVHRATLGAFVRVLMDIKAVPNWASNDWEFGQLVRLLRDARRQQQQQRV